MLLNDVCVVREGFEAFFRVQEPVPQGVVEDVDDVGFLFGFGLGAGVGVIVGVGFVVLVFGVLWLLGVGAEVFDISHLRVGGDAVEGVG